MDLQGKVALVTGAATGIGLAYVKMLLKNGVAHVAIVDINKTAGAEVVSNLNENFEANCAIFIHCDVTKKEELEAAFKETIKVFKKLDIVINNAGIMRDNTWELEISLNYTALVRSTFLALDYMRKDKGGDGGSIVNIGSIIGLSPAVTFPVYSGTKRAVIAFSQSMGHSFHEGRTGVRVIALCPGLTDTALASDAIHYTMDTAWTEDTLASLSKRKRQMPESVAAAMLYILKNAKSGSIWIAKDDNHVYEINIPHYETLKV